MSLLQQTLAMIGEPNQKTAAEAQNRLDQLCKPRGSLGKLETLLVQLAGIQGKARPEINAKLLAVMAADHGAAWEGVSAYPPDAGQKLLMNFLRKGAPVSILADYTKTRLLLVDIGLRGEPIEHPGLCVRRIRSGSGNIGMEAAMTENDAIAAMEAGIMLINQEIDAGINVVALGELGIANTTPSTAILACLSNINPADITGPGAGLDDEKLTRKKQLICQALEINKPDPHNPVDVLSKLGGLEIAALTGAILACAARRVPVVLDGFVCGAAAMLASRLNARCCYFLLAAHLSEEPGHKLMLADLGLKPLLDLGLRLGEGTGAVLALPLLEAAVNILQDTATLEEAGFRFC